MSEERGLSSEEGKEDPQFVPMTMYHDDMVKLEHRLTRVEVIAAISGGGGWIVVLLKLLGRI